jgi:hypothetical protein
MAITRAQQVRQMLEDGGMLVQPSMTGKRPGYAGPAGGASAGGNYGGDSSGGVGANEMSGAGGGNGDGDDRREQESVTQTKTGTVKTGKTGKRTKVTKDIRDRQRRNYNQQFTSKGIVPPGPNRKKRQRALDYVNKNMLMNYNRFGSYYDPNKFSVTKTGYPNFGMPNLYEEILAAIDAGATVEDIKELENKFAVGKSGTSFEMNPIPDLDIDSIRELASTQTTLQGDSLTGYQAGALGKLKENIEKRDNLIETGDTSNIFPPPPTGAPDDDPVEQDPCKGPNPPAYCFIGDKADETIEAQRNLGGLSARIGGSLFNFDEFAADGGRIGAAEGGIMELARQEMFLGGIAKGIKKAVKGVSRTIKKVAKSPIGKIALAAAAGGYGFGLGPFKSIAGSGFLKGAGVKNFFLKDAAKGFGLSNLSGKGIASIIGGASLLPFLMGPKEEDEFDIESYYAANRLNPNAALNARIAGSQFSFAEGGDVEPVAKKTMPLLDMDGQEMDLRAEGGFVPIGRMEKADDVPARLSKNEFVFTADAVRNAGDGNVDKGAEVMYNMMKNLESGGDVSEESQGLEGAREMFQTSKRLEEVL